MARAAGEVESLANAAIAIAELTETGSRDADLVAVCDEALAIFLLPGYAQPRC